MIEGKWFAPGAEIPEAAAIRGAVFGRGQDALDQESWNVVVYLDGAPVATGRLWWRDGAFFLGDVAVVPEARGKRLGDLTLRLLLFKAQSHAARLMWLVTPTGTAAFFARLGFKPEGEPENDFLRMGLRGDELCLDTCETCKRDCPNRRAAESEG